MVHLFIAFDDTDYDYIKRFEDFFNPLVKNKKITIWHHKKMKPGTTKQIQIDKAINRADMVLYMLSSDFLASDYYMDLSEKVMKRQRNNETDLIPIVLRPCLWDFEPFAQLPMYPNKNMATEQAEAISVQPNEDEVFVEVVRQISTLVKVKVAGEEGGDSPSVPLIDKTRELKKTAIKDLVSTNAIKEAISQAYTLLNDNNKDKEIDLRKIESDYYDLNTNKRRGLITNEQADLQRNKLVYNLLALIDEL
jgi:hypothetical protein